jgi:hypothetical protein
MSDRKHLLVQQPDGRITEIKIDPKYIKKQIKEQAALGNKAYVVTDDELIKFNQTGRI